MLLNAIASISSLLSKVSVSKQGAIFWWEKIDAL